MCLSILATFKKTLYLPIKTLILLYQWFVSPFMGKNCRFYPTCSQYTLIALDEHPLHSALWLIIKRLLRCHPYCLGGIDEVPRRKGKIRA